MVPITVHAGVVGVIERIHDPVFNQGSDAVVAEFVTECFGVVAAISSEAPQVTGVAPGDLRADLRIVFFFEVVEWMSVMYSVSTSTSAVTFSARTR